MENIVSERRVTQVVFLLFQQFEKRAFSEINLRTVVYSIPDRPRHGSMDSENLYRSLIDEGWIKYMKIIAMQPYYRLSKKARDMHK